jgi:hypothetical protein
MLNICNGLSVYETAMFKFNPMLWKISHVSSLFVTVKESKQSRRSLN